MTSHLSARSPRLVAGVAACLLALGIGAVGIGDEAYVSTHGDMPRLLMNGVFLLDLLRDLPVQGLDALMDYAHLYYARYPALSLGHHPPLLPLAEVPAFALFGVSVASARLVILLCAVASAVLLYLMVEKVHGPLPALLASALFVTSPEVVHLSHAVFSECLALALVMVAFFFLDRLCVTGSRGSLVGFVLAAIASLYAKQLAVFLFPVYLLVLAVRLGVRRLFRRDLVVAGVVLAVLVLPIVALTLWLSAANLVLSLEALSAPRQSHLLVARQAVTAQFVPAVLALIGVGAARAAVFSWTRVQPMPLLWVVWAVTGLVCMTVLAPLEPERYSVYGVPALSALAATAVAGVSGWARPVAVIVGLALVVLQGRAAFDRPPVTRAGGYEAAARFVLDATPGPTVFFSGDVDTGYFTFFVRKHDRDRNLIVLRADKILTTSQMGKVNIEEHITAPGEIYDVLRRFGTRYVVIEDRASKSRVLEWLREEVKSPRFVERTRIPFVTSDPRLAGTDLAVYEFLGAGPPDPDAVLRINVPLVGQSVAVRLSDLIERKRLR